MKEMGTRLALIKWFGNYLIRVTKFVDDTPVCTHIKGRIPQ